MAVTVQAQKQSDKPKMIKVYSTFPRIVDLVKDVVIKAQTAETAQLVEDHPWLRAQIDIGHLIEVK